MKKCPYCAEEIQDEAIVCKHCKKDLNHSSKTQTIELTSKNLKKKIVYAVSMVIGSVVLLIFSITSTFYWLATISAFAFWAGIIWFIIIRVQIWWHHE